MTAQRSSRTTIYDVARLAGVSHQTVSRVVNNELGVASGTRERVLEAVARLGYRRRAAARSLASATRTTLGVLSTGVRQYGPAQTLLGIHRAAAQRHVPILSGLFDERSGSHVQEVLQVLVAEEPIALIVVTDSDQVVSDASDICARAAMPLVLASAAAPGAARWFSSVVQIDQQAAGEEAVAQLVQRGVRSIAFLPGPKASADAQARQDGVLRAAATNRIPVTLLPEGDWTIAAGYRAIDDQQLTDIDAVIAANDRMAVGLLHRLRELGLDTARDIQVVGFDDSPEAVATTPTLSSMRLNFEVLGVLAVRAALQTSGTPHTDICIKSHFVARETVTSVTQVDSARHRLTVSTDQ